DRAHGAGGRRMPTRRRPHGTTGRWSSFRRGPPCAVILGRVVSPHVSRIAEPGGRGQPPRGSLLVPAHPATPAASAGERQTRMTPDIADGSLRSRRSDAAPGSAGGAGADAEPGAAPDTGRMEAFPDSRPTERPVQVNWAGSA